MKITVEKRQASQGKKSLRLCFYSGYSTDENGKIKHQRRYEALNLFIYDKPKSPEEKHHNKEALRLAEAIRSKRIVEHQSGIHGFVNPSNNQISFYSFFQKLTQEKHRTTEKSNAFIWDCAYKQLIKYHADDVTFEQLTPAFIKGFKEYLVNTARTKSNEKLSKNTASSYFNKVRAAINEAYHQGIIKTNPLNQVPSIKGENNKREYLSIEEVRQLVKTECRYIDLKRAFLFSCLTGLRWSDIVKLTWQDVQVFNDHHRVIFKQQKTKGLQYLDLSPQAYALLGDKKAGKIFSGVRYSAYMNVELLRWCLAAGISKHITFHAARHTFAVTQLTLGTDIYTLSRLLGHSEIKTTEIYADIIDSQRKMAMMKIPDIGL